MIERPLVFIPGIYCSTLAINDNIFWPPSKFSSSTVRDVLDKLGTNIRTTVGQDVPAVANALFPSIYDVFINSMSSSSGYTPDNFWTFPYDWRQSNNISGKMLTDFIKNKIQGTNWDAVDVVCHSMGGFVARAAIVNHRAPIKRTVYIATPHYGTPQAYFALNPEIHTPMSSIAQGFLFFLTLDKDLKDLLDADTILEKDLKHLFRKWPSMYELMPDRFYLDKEAMIFLNGILSINGVDKTYLSGGLEFKLQEMRDQVNHAMEFKDKMGEKLRGEQDDILVIFNEDNQTLDRVYYNDKTKDELVLPSSLKTGDLLVVAKSAMCSMSGSPLYNSRSISKCDHLAIPNDQRTINEIMKYLNPLCYYL
jgi:pimeloyl-ACP methyl ester carboxylesterase